MVWCPPLTLLFGSAAAFLLYNCFSLIVAGLACRFFRPPVLNYFGDLGCALPGAISVPGQKVSPIFFRLVGFPLHRKKTKIGRNAIAISLEGAAPGRGNGMRLSVDSPGSKTELRPRRISDFITAGWIPHKELEPLTGRLSCSRNSIFGRFGRVEAHPLHWELGAEY